MINSWGALRSLSIGKDFESAVENGCRQYALDGRAIIHKIPEPFTCIKKGQGGVFRGRFIGKAQPDFCGTLKGGKAIVMETKATQKDRICQNVLTKTQSDVLMAYHNIGAEAFVCISIQDNPYTIPYLYWSNMHQILGRKYAMAEDLKQYRVKRTLAMIRFLDYECKK